MQGEWDGTVHVAGGPLGGCFHPARFLWTDAAGGQACAACALMREERARVDRVATSAERKTSDHDVRVVFATVRDSEDAHGDLRYDIECRFADGAKYAPISVDGDHEELALLIAATLSASSSSAKRKTSDPESDADTFATTWEERYAPHVGRCARGLGLASDRDEALATIARVFFRAGWTERGLLERFPESSAVCGGGHGHE